MSDIDDPRVRDAFLLLADAIGGGLPNNGALRDALRALMRWVPESKPAQFSADNPYYTEGDEKQPFFSEAYLYVLLGKMDARTLLALFDSLCRALGFSDEEVHRLELQGDSPSRLLIVSGPLRGTVIHTRNDEWCDRLRSSLRFGADVGSVWLGPDQIAEEVLQRYPTK